jgi:hypothetical protein
MVAQMSKRAGKRTWRPEHVVRAAGVGGVACATGGVASTAGLKVVLALSVPLSM